MFNNFTFSLYKKHAPYLRSTIPAGHGPSLTGSECNLLQQLPTLDCGHKNLIVIKNDNEQKSSASPKRNPRTTPVVFGKFNNNKNEQ